MTTPRVYTVWDASNRLAPEDKVILLSDHKEVVAAQDKYFEASVKGFNEMTAICEQKQAEIERLKGVIDKWSAANLRQTEAIEKLKGILEDSMFQLYGRASTKIRLEEIERKILQEAK